MNRFQIRGEVRFILRDETYPELDINSAINRVIGEINSDRYRFQQTIQTITIVAGTYRYTVPDTMIADYSLVWALGVQNKQKVINKGSEMIDPLSTGKFITTGDEPDMYWRFGPEFWIDPVPTATMAAYGISALSFKDIPDLNGDLEEPSRIPARFHRTVLAYGAAAQITPAALVRTAAGTISVSQAYEKSLILMKRQEGWEPYKTERFDCDDRFALAHLWGNVGGIS